MMRELLDHMTFVYGFICKGRGRIKEDEAMLTAPLFFIIISDK